MKKKNTIVLLILIIAITCTFVSCEDFFSKDSVNTKDLVEVSLKAETEDITSTKTLSNSAVAPTAKTWKYTAKVKNGKTTSNPGIGAVSSEKEFISGSETLSLSKGWWTFTVYGYDKDSKIVYYGTTDVEIKSSTTVVTAKYSKTTISLSGDKVAKAKVTFADKFSIEGSSNKIAKAVMKYKKGTASAVACTTDATVSPGSNTFTLTYTDESSNTFSGKITFTAYAGYTYTIGGSVNINGVINVTLSVEEDTHYEVSFDTNYQTVDKEDTVTVLTSTTDGENQKVTAPAALTVLKKKSVFGGWNTADDGTGTTYAAGASITVTADTTLYAQWDPLYTVTFDLDGGNGTTPAEVVQTTKEGKVTLPSEIAEAHNTGMLLEGWTDGTTTYDPGDEYTPAADITLKAIGKSWAQLWAGGPKWATMNVGATKNSYKGATEYSVDYIGGTYQFGGIVDGDTGTTSGTNYSNSSSDIQYKGTKGTDPVGDTAKLLWGDNWQMPKLNDLWGLTNHSANSTWVEDSKRQVVYKNITGEEGNQYVEGCTLKGISVIGKTEGYTENSIFLPSENVFPAFWNSSVSSGKVVRLICHFNGASFIASFSEGERNKLFSVRAILHEE